MKLTQLSGDVLVLDSSTVSFYAPDNGHTRVRMRNGKEYRVQESREQIRQLLYHDLYAGGTY